MTRFVTVAGREVFLSRRIGAGLPAAISHTVTGAMKETSVTLDPIRGVGQRTCPHVVGEAGFLDAVCYGCWPRGFFE